MTVKINRYKVSKSANFKGDKARAIIDYSSYREIITFDTDNEETNQKLAEVVLNELNTGKYEEKK